jgi:hypothetical protein
LDLLFLFVDLLWVVVGRSSGGSGIGMTIAFSLELWSMAAMFQG